MRHTPNLRVEKYRVEGPPNSNSGGFLIPNHLKTAKFVVICSDGEGFDHVSVSLGNRCPTWAEMCWIKELFFKDTEAAMQLHPPTADHINLHQFCLHLWRPQTEAEMQAIKEEWMRGGDSLGPNEWKAGGTIPMPPKIMV